MHNSVFAVPVRGEWLVHAPLHSVTALVNAPAVAALADGSGRSLESPLASLHAALADDPVHVPQPRQGDLSPDFLGLIPTRTCNLACVYCGFGAGTAPAGYMEFETATSAVDWMAERMRELGRRTLEVHFFGGEPFCAPEVVDATVHYARAVAAQQGLLPRFEVATNGVLDDDRARFVGDYFDTVVLSLDGPEQIHDRHRPRRTGGGSYGAVARVAHLLRESPTELCLRVCVTRDTAPRLEEIARRLCDDFRPSVIDFETLQPTPESDEAGLEPPDPWDFAAHCVRACRAVEQSGVQAVFAAALAETPRLSFCPVGNDTVIVSPDGRVSACYLPDAEWKRRGMDLDLGRLDGDGRMQLDPRAVARVRALATDKPRCVRCFCRWSCAGGCHVNHSYTGCPDTYDDFCILTRIITACHLLRDLGHDPCADALLEDRAAQEALGLRSTDCLQNWERADG